MVNLKAFLLTFGDVNSKSTKTKSPRIPKPVKYGTWFVWSVIVSCLVYQQRSINYFLFIGRLVWLLQCLVSLRDGKTGLTSVEYNIQSKSIVGMVCYLSAIWFLTASPSTTSSILSWLNYTHHNVLYCAVGLCAGYLLFESPFIIMYCRPSPWEVTRWKLIESSISLPIFLLVMIAIEQNVINYDIGHSVVLDMIAYKFTCSLLDFQKVCAQKTATVPHKHQFTTSLDTTVHKKVEEPTNQNVWRIYGNTYDLTNYVKYHPGGVEAIMLGANRDDCTAMFQSYHPFNIGAAKAVLAKYRIDDKLHGSIPGEKKKQANNYAHLTARHENDLFYDVLSTRVAKALKDAGVDPIRDRTPTLQRYSYYSFLMIAIIASCVSHCRVS